MCSSFTSRDDGTAARWAGQAGSTSKTSEMPFTIPQPPRSQAQPSHTDECARLRTPGLGPSSISAPA
jgi:hypothetical protein